MFLSPHFSLEELTSSSFALKHHIDNMPNFEQLQNLKECAQVLEKIRSMFGNHPIVINSGFRCELVNKGVKGSPTSSHLEGLAFDIVIKNGLSIKENAVFLYMNLKEFDQIIVYKTFIHLGLGPKKRLDFFKGSDYL